MPIYYKPRTVDILSFLYTTGYFITLVTAFFFPFPEVNRDALNVLLGILSTIMLTIVASYFSKDTSNSATATAIKALADTNLTPNTSTPVPVSIVGAPAVDGHVPVVNETKGEVKP